MPLSRERQRLLARLGRRRGREREGLFVVEGIRAAEAALDARARVRFALASPRLLELANGAALRERLSAERVDTVELTDAELVERADTEAPQGILLVCAEPEEAAAPLPAGAVLALDGVQDPGNLGTLIRAAAGFGARAVLVLDGTVDPYNPKTVRAAAGALFRVSVRRARWEDVAAELAARGPILVADMRGTDVADVCPPASWTLVVGGEGGGPRSAVRRAADACVSVPMPGGTESLNAGVAGSILLYVLTRRAPTQEAGR